MYDESYEVRDGDPVPTPKAGFPPQQRISIRSSPSTVKQKSTSQHPSSFEEDDQQPPFGIRRPSTSATVNNQRQFDPTTGLPRSLETSRATYRVSSAANPAMTTPAERPASRNASGKTRPITPEDADHAGSDEEEEDDDDDEYENVQRDNEESFQNIDSITKRELQESSMDYSSSEDESESLASYNDEGITRMHCRNFSLRAHTGSIPGGTQSIKSSNLIPEDLFDVINESTVEDNEEESLRKYFTRQHYHEIQLDNKRDDIRRRVLARGCDSHSAVGLGVHRHGYWMYNPADYENLKVSPEIKEVFQFITKYVPSPANCQVDVKLKPFIPEYYPSVGDIDAFIKVVHPEIKDDALGMKYLDEPSAFQSDPSVLDLRLRALAKQNSAKAIVVKKVENVSKNAKIIDNWINDISDLHRSKPSPSVHYSKPMPDIDLLIQEWPPEVEELVKNLSFPSPALDCDLATYADIVCNLLDIPVYKSRIQSLHVLSTLYATHKNFSQYGAIGSAQGGGDAMILSSSAQIKHEPDGMVDRLEL